MKRQSLYHTFQRYRTLYTDKIHALPVVILMPHSGCNCRCVMCDIWKGNSQKKMLTEDDVKGVLTTLKALGTQQVVLTGGEALLNPGLVRLCEILRTAGFSITLLTAGLTLYRHAEMVADSADALIASLDGNEEVHDLIRGIDGAYMKLKAGIERVRSLRPNFKITGRSVIHKLNFRVFPSIIESAKAIGLDQISFLPADISSQAFNRETPWDENRQKDVCIAKEELPELKKMLDYITEYYQEDFKNGFIAEPPLKLNLIYTYYNAIHGKTAFPYKLCNAPWVSVVIEPDGNVKPCFFHESLGNIREQPLGDILNSNQAIQFRKELKKGGNPVCEKCVCYLNLPPARNAFIK